ncbi:MAG: MarR family transcriptional regulator [Eubacteriales bacterium]|nr:MarR family transcriptional regulator [Eubacteriales bacterium]
MNYQLELKQLVDYPRCRIYREFIRTLVKDKNIRTNGNSYLFYYILLCSFANYRTSHRRIEGITYTVGAGEWICSIAELREQFRFRFQHQVLSVLKLFEDQHYITYSLQGKNKLVKFKILDWQRDNTTLQYSYPCKKDMGFFFFPIAKVHELIGMGKCSEMDILLDLWIHAIFNDTQVMGSDIGPVIYFRNNTGNPLTSYSELGERWGRSRATICRILKKLEDLDLLSVIPFTGNHGSVIYLKNYLSTMFNISDVMIDKEEVALALSLPIHVPDEPAAVQEPDISSQISVSDEDESVPKTHMEFLVDKVSKLLMAQGIPCCQCSKAKYQLSKFSDCKGIYSLEIICPYGNMAYRFELRITPQADSGSSGLFSNVPFIELKGGNSHV